MDHWWIIKKVDINYDELLYLLTILSDIYSKNGDIFDFDIDAKNNKILFIHVVMIWKHNRFRII